MKCEYCGKCIEVLYTDSHKHRFCSMRCRDHWNDQFAEFIDSITPGPSGFDGLDDELEDVTEDGEDAEYIESANNILHLVSAFA